MVPASLTLGTLAEPPLARLPERSEPKECVVADYFTNSESIQSPGRPRPEEYNRASIRSQLSRRQGQAFRCRMCLFSNSGKKATGCETAGLVDVAGAGLATQK